MANPSERYTPDEIATLLEWINSEIATLRQQLTGDWNNGRRAVHAKILETLRDRQADRTRILEQRRPFRDAGPTRLLLRQPWGAPGHPVTVRGWLMAAGMRPG